MDGKTNILPNLVKVSDNQPLTHNSKEISKALGDVLDSLFFNPSLDQIITARNIKDNYDNAVKYEKRAEENKKLLEKYLAQIQGLLKLNKVAVIKVEDFLKIIDFIKDMDDSNIDSNIENKEIKRLIYKKEK